MVCAPLIIILLAKLPDLACDKAIRDKFCLLKPTGPAISIFPENVM